MMVKIVACITCGKECEWTKDSKGVSYWYCPAHGITTVHFKDIDTKGAE